MANTPRKSYPTLVKVAVGIVIAAMLVICGGLVTGLMVGNDDKTRCENQGGFYKTNGGCDLPYPKR